MQRYKDTVRCATLGKKVPGHSQGQLTQTLIVCLLKTHTCFLLLQKLKGAQAPLEPTNKSPIVGVGHSDDGFCAIPGGDDLEVSGDDGWREGEGPTISASNCAQV